MSDEENPIKIYNVTFRYGDFMMNIGSFARLDCQDEQPPTAQTPEEADEILERWHNGMH
jgi:hypothetical protein